MDEQFEQSFKQNLEQTAIATEFDRLRGLGKKYKILTFVFLAVTLILTILLIVMIAVANNKVAVAECEECDCSREVDGRSSYGDFTILYDEEGNIKELLMVCKTSSGRTFELLDGYQYRELDIDNSVADQGSYSMIGKIGSTMLELSSDRMDKYVYFDGYSLINMDKVFYCLHE